MNSMKLSWTSFKISVAGARLSHLVQKDKIWDHGSMVEQVRNIFYKIESAKNKGETNAVKKYLSERAYNQLMVALKKSSNKVHFKNVTVAGISIIEVKQKPDRFTALIKGKRKANEFSGVHIGKEHQPIKNFSEQWLFVRRGDWWLLDGF